MDLLIPDSGLLFWMTLVFIIVFIILWKAGFPAIIKMVTERKAFIDESLKKAHEANEKLANIQKEGESIYSLSQHLTRLANDFPAFFA